MPASVLQQYTAEKPGMQIYDLQGMAVEKAAIQKSGIYLLRENSNATFQKVTVIK